MSNRIDMQIDDIHALLAEMAQHSRRKRAEKVLGPIKTTCQCPPIPIRSLDWVAYFDNHLDLDCPSWVQATGETEAEAIRKLLDGAEEEIETRRLDEMRMAELERRAGC